MTLILQTMPASVKINIDGRDYDGGVYKQTPVRIPLTPGEHRIKMSRSGYQPETIDIDGAPGSTFREEKIVLRRAAKVQWQNVKITVNPVHLRLPISIDDNFIVGDAPVVVTDLEANRAHSLIFYVPRDRDRGPGYKCQFFTKNANQNLVIRIDATVRNSPRCTIGTY